RRSTRGALQPPPATAKGRDLAPGHKVRQPFPARLFDAHSEPLQTMRRLVCSVPWLRPRRFLGTVCRVQIAARMWMKRQDKCQLRKNLLFATMTLPFHLGVYNCGDHSMALI